MPSAQVDRIARALHDYQRSTGMRADQVPATDWGHEPEGIRRYYWGAAYAVLGFGLDGLAIDTARRTTRWTRITEALRRFWQANIVDEGPDDPSPFDRRMW